MSRFGPLVSLDHPAFIHESALLYGKIAIGRDVSIWPHVVMRAEMSEITVGEGTNIQDFVMVHVGGQTGTRIGRFCSITHHCTIHGATIGDHCLIGINATLMDGVVVGDNCIVAGGAFLKEGTVIPPNSIVMGMPGKVVRTRNSGAANFTHCHICGGTSQPRHLRCLGLFSPHVKLGTESLGPTGAEAWMFHHNQQAAEGPSTRFFKPVFRL